MSPTLSRAVDWLRKRPAVLVAAAAALCQMNTFANQPVLDDGWVIFDNPLVKSLANLPRILLSDYAVAGAATNAGLWRPVTTLSYALNYAAGGTAVFGYHAVNAALHVLVSLLVLCWARNVVASVDPGREGAASLLAALLFAVHPVHVEAVAGMVGRAELLATLGALLALHLVGTRRRARWRLPAGLAAAALGTLSKENAAVAPLLFALVAVAAPAAAGLPNRPGLRAGERRQALLHGCAVALALALAAGLPLLLRPGGHLGVPLQASWFAGRPRGVVLGTMSRALAEYLRLLVFPWELGLDFFYAARIPFVGARSWPAILGAAVWAPTLAAGLLSLRRAPVRALGILWVFAALVPVLNLVPTGVLMAERLLYLPSVGFCLWAGHGLEWAMRAIRERFAASRPIRTAAGAVAVLAVAGLASRTLARNADWRDGESLWRAEIAHAPLDPVVNNNLAVALTQGGDLEGARARLFVALRVAPSYSFAWVNLGIVQQRTGDRAGALASLARARALAPASPRAWFFTALVLADLGDLSQAVDALARAEALAPEDAETRFRRGDYLLRLGRVPEARRELELAAQLDPWHREAHALLESARANSP
ncbi:MAG TPA: tetratricopeptide repeat protein [Anaeromyxobacteraceae bacterium]|nr:tetratricopeptide repeat protein [Anaeromyxobacteraceae bacterium]